MIGKEEKNTFVSCLSSLVFYLTLHACRKNTGDSGEEPGPQVLALPPAKSVMLDGSLDPPGLSCIIFDLQDFFPPI